MQLQDLQCDILDEIEYLRNGIAEDQKDLQSYEEEGVFPGMSGYFRGMIATKKVYLHVFERLFRRYFPHDIHLLEDNHAPL